MDQLEKDLFRVDARQRQEQQALAADVYDLDIMLKGAFGTRNGKKALQYMTDFANQFACDPSLGFEKGAAYGFFAEGMKQMVWDIKQRMHRANQGPPKQQQGDEG